jgi:hypothetical protein
MVDFIQVSGLRALLQSGTTLVPSFYRRTSGSDWMPNPGVALPAASDDRGAVGDDADDTYVLDGLNCLGGYGL